jgi:predicted TIM-barrel fold metal-dependent hydrolase
MGRLIWGSDWLHTLFEKSANYGTERQLLDAWLPDLRERDVVLANTPRDLFRLGA